MSSDSNISVQSMPDSERFSTALGLFSQSMSRLADLQTQTSGRLAKLIRLGMMALVMLFAVVFIMMFVMTQRINLLVDNISAINNHFHNMVPDISHMHSNMIKMQTNMKSMDTMPTDLSQLLSEIDNIHSELVQIREQVDLLEYKTSGISDHTQVIVGELRYIEAPITQIQQDVGKFSRPIRIFNHLMPRP